MIYFWTPHFSFHYYILHVVIHYIHLILSLCLALPAQSITAITVAVIAGLCMTSFALISFIQHVRKNRKRHVEVANFDFQFREHSDSFVKLKTSIFGWKRYISERSSLKDNSSSNLYSLWVVTKQTVYRELVASFTCIKCSQILI